MVERLYEVDTPTNVTPSIHVYNSLGVMIAVWKTDAKLVRSKVSRISMTVLGFLIILSTMFLKQHSFSDVIIATGLALFSYILVYRLGFVFVGKEQRRVIYESVFEH
jgi:membrane-associated phospholipid phosphatase